MKKLLLLLVALTSATLNNAMEKEDQDQKNQGICLFVPNPIIAITTLGMITKISYHPASPAIQYGLQKNDKLTTVLFDEIKKEYHGVIHTLAVTNGEPRTTSCQPIESQADVKALFDEIKEAFDTAPDKKRFFE